MGCTDSPADPPAAHLWQKDWHWCPGQYGVAVEGLAKNCQHCGVFKMPSVWSEELGLPDVGPIWKDYPISKVEFLARQRKWDECGRRLT